MGPLTAPPDQQQNPLLVDPQKRAQIQASIDAAQQAQAARTASSPINAPGTPAPPPPVVPLSAAPRTQAPTIAPPTIPANQQADQANLERLRASPSGVAGIKNPFARIPLQILDAIGGGFFPRVSMLLPGTTLHHQALVRGAEEAVKGDEAQRQGEARRRLESAQATEAEAKAQQLQHPETKAATNEMERFFQQNPQATVADWRKFEIEHPKAGEKVTNEMERFFQQNPNATVADWRDYEAAHPNKAAGAPKTLIEKYLADNPQSSAEDLRDFLNKEPKAKEFSAEDAALLKAVGGDPTKPESLTLPVMKRFRDLKTEHIQLPPQQMVYVPGPNGTSVPTLSKPGVPLPAGTQSIAGVNAANTPTSQTRTMAETAPKVIELVDRVDKLVDQQTKTLGPAASRWNEFMAGKVGAPNPEFTKLRTDVGLLQTILMRMHVGARGGEQMMEHFRGLLDVSKQSPENLKAALEEIKAYAQEVQASGKSGGSGEPTGGVPKEGETFNGHKVLKVEKVQ